MNFSFIGSYSSKEKDLFKKIQEADLIKICDYLEVDKSVGENIKFFVFDSREGKQNKDPQHSVSRASARFQEMTVYRFWTSVEDPHFPHETTHLVAHTWGSPYIFRVELDTARGGKITKSIEMLSTSFMQEGLAIAVDDLVFGRKLNEEGEEKYIDDWCRLQLSKMPKKLERVINLDGFGSLPNKIVVPFSASFSKFLLNKCGVNTFKNMYTRLKETLTPRKNIEIIEGVYSETEEKLLSQWRQTIG